ncbi:MAG: prepilin-type N-terminal cleavage/methylation domain-containing protein [Candidatus Acidiferrales bacterium]
MNNAGKATRQAVRGRTKADGFSLIELMVVIAIIFVVAAMAMISMQPNVQQMRANAAMDQVLEELRTAREYAIANRRWVQVQFNVPQPNQVTVTVKNSLTAGAGPDVVLGTVPLQQTVVFFVFAGQPDTPDGYGNGNAILFAGVPNGPPAGMYFDSTGAFTNAGTGLPITGTVFLGNPAFPSTARAVTVLGGTGRIRAWKGTLTGWFQ